MGRLLALALLALACPAWAGDQPRRGADLDVLVPVEPREHQRLHYFGRRDRHLVPGAVTIDEPGYVCDVDGERFPDRDDFMAHLLGSHRMRPERIPGLVLVRDGRVHFVGEPASGDR